MIKNICSILFASLIYEAVSVALGWGEGFGVWFLPVVFIGTGIPIVLGILRQRKIK